jgi:hypothetical protein
LRKERIKEMKRVRFNKAMGGRIKGIVVHSEGWRGKW